jgi:hypothetical protein
MNRLLICLATTLSLCAATAASAQQSFRSPEDAAAAFVAAARNSDPNGLISVLGPEGQDIVWSGDEITDAETRKKFVAAYDAKHSIATQGDKATMVVGQDDFRVPIPLLRKNEMWRFDAAAGREEVLARRIGQNELSAIQAALAYVDAQYEYAEKSPTGTGVYAQRFVSQPGKKDGLYWPASAGEDQSPLGEFVAKAAVTGRNVTGERAPYHGYYYKILTRQGPAALGGELNYVANDKMIGGFALVAYPAEYRNSGVMTFMVNHRGKVFEQDLGPNTAALAERMTSFNPASPGWKQVTDTIPTR